MFLESSRYYNLKTKEVTRQDGKRVTAIVLRRLPDISGIPHTVEGNDRLDIIAQRQYGNPTMFWRIADANSEMESQLLIKETGRIILVPEQ